jgi:hypothetical protein
VRAPRSLRARVTAAAVAAVALAGIPSALVLLAAIERDGRRAVDSELAARMQEIARRPPDHDHDGFGLRGDHGGLLVGSGTFAQVDYGGGLFDRQGDVPDHAPAIPASDGLATVTIAGEPWPRSPRRSAASASRSRRR